MDAKKKLLREQARIIEKMLKTDQGNDRTDVIDYLRDTQKVVALRNSTRRLGYRPLSQKSLKKIVSQVRSALLSSSPVSRTTCRPRTTHPHSRVSLCNRAAEGEGNVPSRRSSSSQTAGSGDRNPVSSLGSEPRLSLSSAEPRKSVPGKPKYVADAMLRTVETNYTSPSKADTRFSMGSAGSRDSEVAALSPQKRDWLLQRGKVRSHLQRIWETVAELALVSNAADNGRSDNMESIVENPASDFASQLRARASEVPSDLVEFAVPGRIPVPFYEATADSDPATAEGCVSLVCGKYERSLRCFSEALQINIENVCATMGKAVSYLMLGQFVQARSGLEAVLKVSPKNPYAFCVLAALYLKTQDWDLCLGVSRVGLDAANLSSKSASMLCAALPEIVPLLYRMRCICHFQLGQLLQASEDYLMSDKCRIFREANRRMRYSATTRASKPTQCLYLPLDHDKSPTLPLSSVGLQSEPSDPATLVPSFLLSPNAQHRRHNTTVAPGNVSIMLSQLRHCGVNQVEEIRRGSVFSVAGKKPQIEFYKPWKRGAPLMSLARTANVHAAGSTAEILINGSRMRPRTSVPAGKTGAKTLRPSSSAIATRASAPKTERNEGKVEEDDVIDQVRAEAEMHIVPVSREAEKEAIAEKQKAEQHILTMGKVKILQRRFAELSRIDKFKVEAAAPKKKKSGYDVASLDLEGLDFLRRALEQEGSKEEAMQQIDEVTKSIFFFSKFASEERIRLLRSASFESHQAGHAIFRQGDVSDKMYVILKGAVAASIPSSTPGKEPVVISTQHDGDHFGESLEKDSARRATCVCATSTQLLALPLSAVREVVEELVHVKLKDDMPAVRKNVFFRDILPEQLFPLLCNMTRLDYSYGEFVVREGETPKGIYIIKKGHCKVCIESIGFRSTRKTAFSKNEPKKLYEPDEKLLTLKRGVQDKVNRGFNNYIIYTDDKGHYLPDKVMYQNIIPLADLRENDTFGERVLLPPTFSFNEDATEAVKHESDPALFSVIADSADVEIFLISRELLTYLSKVQCERIYDLIRSQNDPSRPNAERDVEQLKLSYAKWENFKMNMTERVMCQQSLRKLSQGAILNRGVSLHP